MTIEQERLTPMRRGVFSYFETFCSWANCTPAERDQLAWFLAMFRARKTYEALK